MQTKPQTSFLSWLAILPLMGIVLMPIYAHADDDSDHASFSVSDMPQRFERHEFRESMPDRVHFVGDDRSSDRDFRDGNADVAGRFDHRGFERIDRSDAPTRIRRSDQEEDGADRVTFDGDNMTGFSDDQPSDWDLGYGNEGMTSNDDDSDFGGDNMIGFTDDQPIDWDSHYNAEVTTPYHEDRDHDPSYTFYLPN